MKVSVNLSPTSVIQARLGIEPNGRVHKFFTNTCYKHMDKYVPEDTGDLRSNVDIEVNRITYKSPYAHYMYKGKLYVDPKTEKGAFYSPNYGFWSRKGVAKIPSNRNINYKKAGTGSYWDLKMKSAEMDEVIKETQAYLDKGGK